MERTLNRSSCQDRGNGKSVDGETSETFFLEMFMVGFCPAGLLQADDDLLFLFNYECKVHVMFLLYVLVLTTMIISVAIVMPALLCSHSKNMDAARCHYR